MKKCTIVMYHYVRELPYTRFPDIKALLFSEFKEQIHYMKKHYTFVTMKDCIEAVYTENKDFPHNAALLTFDDAYVDHFVNVFPFLNENNIQGCFFAPAKAVLKNKILDVNKIHFLLASAKNINAVLEDIFSCLDGYRDEYNLKSNDAYFEKLAKANRFDTKEVIFIKRLLQVELEESLRNKITSHLFEKYVSKDEKAFSRELYMSVDQLKCMNRNGMYVGSHGYDHYWLNSLSSEEQVKEVDACIEFLKMVGTPLEQWTMCYPYGAFDQQLIRTLKAKNYKLGLTTHVDIADLSLQNAFTLQRLDTNDLPKLANSEPNSWTKKVLNVVA